jgi:hypothetical protein
MVKHTRKSHKVPAVGSKLKVWHGTAKHTPGGLTKGDLMRTKNGRIVSKKKHASGKKAILRLKKLGYVAKKGTFKLFKKGSKRGGSDSFLGKMMGGSDASMGDLSSVVKM